MLASAANVVPREERIEARLHEHRADRHVREHVARLLAPLERVHGEDELLAVAASSECRCSRRRTCPRADGSSSTLFVARSQIAGSKTSPLKSSIASRLPSGDQRSPRTGRLSANTGCRRAGLGVDDQHAHGNAARVGRIAVAAEVLAVAVAAQRVRHAR